MQSGRVLAGLSLARSSTYYVLNDISEAETPEDPDERIDAGELIIVFDGKKYKIGRGVNSLVTFTTEKTEDEIIVREDADIDEIADKVAKKVVEVVVNMG